ncbi:hypothetical protein M9H77_06529 [Catharanthus roseus]|uniref:Uncharacterized protein n=1 Tax=Catharanthus roseus TaxID=4058 RepID=A0ACC0BSJ4_CATRO|nr:hypothetical protein M9H77_06529 [Catharanthus roseus]
MENEGSLDYKIYKTISYFTLTSNLYFDHFLKGTKLNSFALIFYRCSLEHPCTWTLMLGSNHTKNSEDQEDIVGKVFQCHEDSSLCHFLNSSLLSQKVSYHELMFFFSILHFSCVFYYHLPFKDVINYALFEEMSKKLFLSPWEMNMKIWFHEDPKSYQIEC